MRRPTRFTVAAGLLGFAFGGFLDGIVLHQLLQWHHLLSGVAGGRFADLRVQVLADGLFHAAMYVLGLAGLVLLMRPGAALPPAGVTRRGQAFAGRFLLGFALWHGLDALVAHALLGLHRIRMDVPNPWPWDIGWLVVFGGVPAVVGAWLVRRAAGPTGGPAGRSVPIPRGRVEVPARPTSPGPRREGGRWLPASLALLTLVAGLLAAGPATGRDEVVLLRRPGVPPGRVMAAIGATDVRLLWVDATASVFVVRPAPDDPGRGSSGAPGWRDGVIRLTADPWAAGCVARLR